MINHYVYISISVHVYSNDVTWLTSTGIIKRRQKNQKTS